jgi:hypothetical protein
MMGLELIVAMDIVDKYQTNKTKEKMFLFFIYNFH